MSHTRTVVLFGILIALVSLNALAFKAIGMLRTIQSLPAMQQAYSVAQQSTLADIRLLLDPHVPSQLPELATPLVQP